MEALVISGTLGTGKTTTLVGLLSKLKTMENVHLVVNEVGAYATDIDRVNQAAGGQLDVSGLTAGCLGCANLAEFTEIVEGLATQDGLLVIEPTGVADGHEIQAALAQFNMPWHCLTLVNPQTFADDKRVGVLDSQLEVATMVGITRPEMLSEPERDALLISLAPYGVSVIDVPLGSDLSIDDLLQNSVTIDEPHTSHEHDHGHHHSHHDHHDHHHGDYVTTPVTPCDDITMSDVRDVCEQLSIRRAKGVVGRQWFDCVGGVFTVGDMRDESPYIIFIDTEPIPESVIAELADITPTDSRSLKQRLAGIGVEEASVHVNRLLSQAGGSRDDAGDLRISDESIDLAVDVAKASGSTELLQMAMQVRISHTLDVYDLMVSWDDFKPDQLVEVGAILAWQSAKRGDSIGQDLLAEVRERRPATMWLDGIERLAQYGSPRYDLMKSTYGGPLSPAAGSVIAQWGVEHEDIDPRNITHVFGRMASASSAYPEWSSQWHDAADALHATV